LNTPVIAKQKNGIRRSMECDDFIAASRNRPPQREQIYGCPRWRPASSGWNMGKNNTSIFDYLERFGVGIKIEPHRQDRRKPLAASDAESLKRKQQFKPRH
jgi:hypothetical protein